MEVYGEVVCHAWADCGLPWYMDVESSEGVNGRSRATKWEFLVQAVAA